MLILEENEALLPLWSFKDGGLLGRVHVVI
jgi:hypothetical protein